MGSRLLRHATRSGGRSHRIRGRLKKALSRVGMAGEAPPGKAMRWHIDHLLDSRAVVLKAVIAARGPERLEPLWAGVLESDPHTRVVEKGLGAGDAPGSTHLLRVEAGEGWWARLPRRLPATNACR